MQILVKISEWKVEFGCESESRNCKNLSGREEFAHPLISH